MDRIEMERGRGGPSPFLANHGYFVSTLSDGEDDDYWSEEGREEHRHTEIRWSPEIQGRNCNRQTNFAHFSCHIDCAPDSQQPSNITYMSQLQIKKSRACSEASKYFLQRSRELLMAEESSDSPSVQPSGKRLQHYVMKPTREVVVTSRVMESLGNLEHGHPISGAACTWTRNLEDTSDDYPDPIDMELYYNQPQRASLHEAKKLKMKVHHNNQTYRHFTSNRVSPELIISDWGDGTRQADTDAYNSHSVMTQPQRECKDLTIKTTVYPFRKTACDRRDDTTSRKPKQLSRQFRSLRSSQERGLQGSKKRATSVNNPLKRSPDPVKNCSIISGRGSLRRITEPAHDFLQKLHSSNGDLITGHEKESRIQDPAPVSPTMRRKHMRSSHHRRGCSKRQHQEAHDNQGDARIICDQVPSLIANPRVEKYREDSWTLANIKEAYNHGSLRAPCLAKQGEHWDQRNAFWTSQSPEESQENTQREHFNQKDEELGIMDTTNARDYITAPERENSAAIEIRNSKMVKTEAPSTQSVKEQLLSAINMPRKVRQNSTQSNASKSVANELGEESKSLNTESPHSKCLRERRLQTLNVIEYKTPERDGKTICRLRNRTEGTHRPGVGEAHDKKGMAGNVGNVALSSDVIVSENSRTDVNTCRRKGGVISHHLTGKENADQTKNIGVPSGLLEREGMENRKLPAPSTVTENQRLQVSIYSPSQQVEETNVEVQEDSKEPASFVENKSRDVIQVDVEAPEQYMELALQSNRLLKLLRDLQVQGPAPRKCYENTSIINTKTEGMTDPAPQCGYLAQYLKMKNIGTRGLLTTRR